MVHCPTLELILPSPRLYRLPWPPSTVSVPVCLCVGQRTLASIWAPTSHHILHPSTQQTLNPCSYSCTQTYYTGILTLMWSGRCSSLKMTVLPRILYLMQTLPIRLPITFFKRINTMFCNFVSIGNHNFSFSFPISPDLGVAWVYLIARPITERSIRQMAVRLVLSCRNKSSGWPWS